MRLQPLGRGCPLLFCLFFLLPFVGVAQDSSSLFSKGKLYGQVFGDYFFKSHADSLGRGKNQYGGDPDNGNGFEIRRVYLGYQYTFSDRFSANILLESTWQHDNLSLYIKYANLSWKNLFPGSDLFLGRIKTPTYSTLTGKLWGYRAVERSISDMHGNPSYDLGIALRGQLDERGHWGYSVMVGNGTGNDPASDRYKKFYGELYRKLLGDRLILDLYADYERLRWRPGYHQSAAMFKLAVAYQTPGFTIGVEGYRQRLQNGAALELDGRTDTLNVDNYAVSAFAHGTFAPQWGYFARLDHFIPVAADRPDDGQLHSLVPAYDAGYHSRFITAGIDYTPLKQVHIMPNIWLCRYKNSLGAPQTDYDMVYRLTFFFKFEG